MGVDSHGGGGYGAHHSGQIGVQAQRELERLARRNAQLEEQVRALLVLRDVANTLSAELDLHPLLRRFAMAAVRLSQAAVGAVYLCDPVSNALTVEAVETTQTAADSGAFSALAVLEHSWAAYSDDGHEMRPRLPLGEGVAGRVAATGQFVLIPDATADPRFPLDALATDIGVLGVQPASLLVVPMIFRGTVTGVLEVAQAGRSDGFDARSLDFMRTLATQAAAAVANAQLYRRLRAERDRVIQAQEDERRRIARELHDGPAQQVAQIAMGLEYAAQLAQHDPEQLIPELHALRETAVATNKALRNVLFDLRPLILESEQGGLVAAIRRFLDRFKQGPVMHLDAQYEERCPHTVELTVFAILQEAVNNVVKHAQARNCWIELHRTPEKLVARVRDDGQGFDTYALRQEYEQRGSWGMLNMMERAALIDAKLTVGSQPGKGTVLVLEVPS